MSMIRWPATAPIRPSGIAVNHHDGLDVAAEDQRQQCKDHKQRNAGRCAQRACRIALFGLLATKFDDQTGILCLQSVAECRW